MYYPLPACIRTKKEHRAQFQINLPPACSYHRLILGATICLGKLVGFEFQESCYLNSYSLILYLQSQSFSPVLLISQTRNCMLQCKVHSIPFFIIFVCVFLLKLCGTSFERLDFEQCRNCIFLACIPRIFWELTQQFLVVL